MVAVATFAFGFLRRNKFPDGAIVVADEIRRCMLIRIPREGIILVAADRLTENVRTSFGQVLLIRTRTRTPVNFVVFGFARTRCDAASSSNTGSGIIGARRALSGTRSIGEGVSCTRNTRSQGELLHKTAGIESKSS